MKKISANIISLILAVLVFILDQASKAAALRYLSHGPAALLRGFLQLNLVINKGAAFGILSLFTKMIIVINAIVLAVLIFIIFSRAIGSPLLRIAIGLFVGGTAGNLLDRLRFGGVIDFIDFGWFPVFNIADTALSFGVALIILYVIKNKSFAADG